MDHLVSEYQQCKIEAFDSVADGSTAITGSDILDYIEISMRFAGKPGPDASQTAERLAPVFVPSEAAKPLAVYFTSPTSESRAKELIVIGSEGVDPATPPIFSMRHDRDVAYEPRDLLLVQGDGSLTIFARGGYPNWFTAHSVDRRMNLINLEVIDDPEKVIHAVDFSNDILARDRKDLIFTGEAAKQAVVLKSLIREAQRRDVLKAKKGDIVDHLPDTVFDPETTALLALMRIRSGQAPDQPFRDDPANPDGETHQQKALGLAKRCAVSLLEDKTDELMAAGLPVLLDSEILKHQGIADEDIHRVMVEAIVQSGEMLDSEIVGIIIEAMEADKKSELPSEIFEGALLRRAQELQKRFKDTYSGCGLEISPERILASAQADRELFRRGFMMRKESPFSAYRSTVNNAVSAHFRPFPHKRKKA